MPNHSPQQIVLDVDLPDEQTFTTLVAGENGITLAHCHALVDQSATDNSPFLTYISGASATGKSHLLVAMCHRAAELQLEHFYISLNQDMSYPVEMLHSMENLDLLCIDNVHLLAGKPDWQRGLFDLINRIKESPRCKLVVSAAQGPLALDFELPDLLSRLSWGVSFNLMPLDDQDAEKALMRKVNQRGLKIPAKSLRFLVTHTRRDMLSLTQTLEVLQTASLQQKRKISISFIKQILSL